MISTNLCVKVDYDEDGKNKITEAISTLNTIRDGLSKCGAFTEIIGPLYDTLVILNNIIENNGLID